MFRSLYESFENTSGDSSQQYMTNLFNNAVPSPLSTRLPASEIPSPIPAQNQQQMNWLDQPGIRQGLAEATADAIGGKIYTQPDQNPVDRFNAYRIPGALIVAQQNCKTTNYDDVISAAPDRKYYGCGWVVEPNNIMQAKTMGKPFLGTPRGILNVTNDVLPPGNFYWDMDKLQQEMKAAQATTVKSCDQLATSPYKDGLGWCLTNAAAIAVDNRGHALYKNSFGQPECDPSRIILPSQQCPRDDPAATGNVNGAGVVRDANGLVSRVNVIDPRTGQVCEDNSLSRECVIQAVRQAGCTDQGALLQALNTSTDLRNYIGALKNNNAFATYQATAPVKLNNSIFESGDNTIAASLDNFKGLYSQANAASATDARTTSLGYSAIDLCMRQGKFLEYDKCMEYTDATTAPYDLDCMQKAFKMAGGQGAGLKYPTNENRTSYELQYPTWGQLLAYFRQLKEKMSSDNVIVQEAALRDLLGVKRETLNRISISKIDAYEVYNFASSDGILDVLFTGRRVNASQDLQGYAGGLPAFDGYTSPGQVMPNLSPSFVIITDLRPGKDLANPSVQFGFTAKDGIVMTMNKNMTNYQSDLIVDTRPDEFSNNRQRGRSEFIFNKACTLLNPVGNNRLKVYWNNKIAGDAKAFEMFWSVCGTLGGQTGYTAPSKIPKEWISLTQGRYAPMLSFQANDTGFGERRLPEFFPVETNGVMVDMAAKDANPAKLAIARFTSPNSKFRIVKMIMGGSFNAISICFRITQPVNSSFGDLMFSFGNIAIFARSGNKITVNVKNKNADFMYEQGKWYYLLLETSVGSGSQITGINVSIYPLDKVAAGEATLKESVNNQKLDAGTSIIDVVDQKNVLVLGKNNIGGNEFTSAVMDVAWLHMFDYAFRGLPEQEIKNRLQRDANGAWPINWY